MSAEKVNADDCVLGMCEAEVGRGEESNNDVEDEGEKNDDEEEGVGGALRGVRFMNGRAANEKRRPLPTLPRL